MVEGLDDDGFALISKTHHALVDGVAGVDLMTMLFDASPEGRDEGPPQPWAPHPSPSSAQLAAAALEDSVGRVATLPLRAAAALAKPGRALADARETAAALGEVVRQGMSPAPETPLNLRISSHRRLAVASAPLADFKKVKDALGGTVNDVVLAVVAGGVRAWLHGRGVRAEGMDMRACVPISIRARSSDGALGNQITQVVRAAAGVRRRSGRAAAHRPRGDGRAEGVAGGPGRPGHRGDAGLRPADHPRPVLAAQLLQPVLQPARHQHPRPAGAPLRAGARLESVFPVAFLAGIAPWPWRRCPTRATSTSA